MHKGKVPKDENAAHMCSFGECLVVSWVRFLQDFEQIRNFPRLSQKEASSTNTAIHHSVFFYEALKSEKTDFFE